jgi:hypothetical protein
MTDDVRGERIDSETLAAFLDGALPPAERARVMRVLAESPEEYSQFVEAAAVKRDLVIDASPAMPPETSALQASSSRSRATRWSRARYIVPFLVAAGFTGLIIVRRFGTDAAAGSIAFVQDTRLVRPGSGSVATVLGEAWDQPGWSVVRGGGVNLGDRASAFRAGVRYAELEVAAKAADSAAVMRLSEPLAQTVGGIDAGAPVAAQFRELARAPDFGGSARRARAAEELRSLSRASAWFDAGAWTEMARLALAANQLSLFAPNGKAIAELQRIVGALESSPEQRSAASPLLDALQPLLSGRNWSTGDRDSLSRILQAAMVAGAR